jgi:hypothetical protein
MRGARDGGISRGGRTVQGYPGIPGAHDRTQLVTHPARSGAWHLGGTARRGGTWTGLASTSWFAERTRKAERQRTRKAERRGTSYVVRPNQEGREAANQKGG